MRFLLSEADGWMEFPSRLDKLNSTISISPLYCWRHGLRNTRSGCNCFRRRSVESERDQVLHRRLLENSRQMCGSIKQIVRMPDRESVSIVRPWMNKKMKVEYTLR